MTKNRWNIGNIAAAVSLICAVTVTGLVIRREFTSSAPIFRPRGVGDYNPRPVEQWRQLIASGHRMGPDSAIFTVLEFADFECPACRKFFLGALAPLKAMYPTEVAVVFRHWPLSYHKFSYAAARAAECAGEQGRFEQMHNLMYQFQDSIGLKSFEHFGRGAGVEDPLRFKACITPTDSLPKIAADIATVMGLGGRGTPTLVINGMLLEHLPDSAGLFAMFDRTKLESKQ